MTESTDTIPSNTMTDVLTPLDPTRRGFLALAAVAGAAAIVLPALPARAVGFGELADQLGFLEATQFFQSQFFAGALQSGSIDGLTPSNGLALLNIANQDNEQARWIKTVRKQRGFMATPNSTLPSSLTEPDFAVARAYGTREKFFDSALAIKEAGVGVFHGLVAGGGDGDIVQAVAALAGVQNRHLAMLREMAGLDPFDTYVEALTVQQASKTLGKYGFDMEVAV